MPNSSISCEKESIIPEDYKAFLIEIKGRIKKAQIKAAVAVNTELIHLYWEIGRLILDRQKTAFWGDQILDNLAVDLRLSFPEMRGFSRRNLYYMRRFAESFPQFVQQAVAQIPWGHNVLLINKLDTPEERLWYAQKTVENGWSRSSLAFWIDAKLYEREGKAINNFDRTMPKADSDLAQNTLKDPYNFDFLTLREDYLEKDLEQGLIDHIQRFMIEMGSGFAFLGRQYPLVVSGREYFIDLLFYHVKLRRYCVIELKNTDFKPEYAGKLNFYLTAINRQVKHEDDLPTIGMILCKSKDNLTVEYALDDFGKPIGVSDYEVEIMNSLPSAEELNHHLEMMED